MELGRGRRTSAGTCVGLGLGGGEGRYTVREQKIAGAYMTVLRQCTGTSIRSLAYSSNKGLRDLTMFPNWYVLERR